MEAMTTSHSAKLTLPADNQILITRDFAAPRHLVYKAMTTPELVKQWWHAKRGKVSDVEIDLRVGGKWRYAMVTTDGEMEVAFHGEFREIVEYERVVQTEAYEGIPDPDANASLNTMTMTDIDGGTHVEILIEHPTKEGRDGQIESGMEAGLQDALDLLEELASSLE
jgi:uncharacterized protein YndB with AHSA1/START domain